MASFPLKPTKKTPSTQKKPSKTQQKKQLNLHEFYQPNTQFPPKTIETLEKALDSSLEVKPLKPIKNSMNEELQTKPDESTLMKFSTYSPVDRNHIFPPKEEDTRKKLSIANATKRKFSTLDSEKSPISPSLKKAQRCGSFLEIGSLQESLDCQKTIEKGLYSYTSDPQYPMNFQSQTLECEEKELEAMESDEKLFSSEELDEHFIDIPVDMKYLALNDMKRYTPNERYLAEKQKHMNWNMRAILMDWMMEVCNDYSLKRPTFLMATNYVDRFLSEVPDMPKNKLQLLGLVSLYLAAKLEEVFPPKLKEFAQVGCDYSLDEIKDFEEKLIRQFKFSLHPSGIHFWAEWFTFNWDMLIEEKAGVPEKNLMEMELLQFKQMDEKNYKLFRELFQLMDCAILDYEILAYEQKNVVLTFICMLLWGYLMKLDIKKMSDRYEEILKEDDKGVYKLLEEFVKRADGCKLESLRECLPFCAKFFELEMDYDYPLATKLRTDEVLEGNYAEFLAYQTHNPNNLTFLRNLSSKKKI